MAFNLQSRLQQQQQQQHQQLKIKTNWIEVRSSQDNDGLNRATTTAKAIRTLHENSPVIQSTKLPCTFVIHSGTLIYFAVLSTANNNVNVLWRT